MPQDNKAHQLMFRAVQVSLFGNILLFIIKVTALVFVNSLAIMTDLGLTVVSLAVSGILYYSVKLSNRPADLLHNYGYGKVEHVCEALEGIVLIGIALAMSFQAVMHFFHPSEVGAPWLGFWFSAVCTGINFIGAFWIFALAKRCHSPAVHAEGVHYQMEAFISLTITAAFLFTALLLLTPLKAWAVFLDPAATLLVSLLVTIPSFQLAKHAFVKLLDVSIEEKGKMEVIKILGKYIGSCCEFRDIRSRSSGRRNYVELKVTLPPLTSLPDAYNLTSSMEQDLRENIADCEATVIAVPCTENCVSHAVSPEFAAAISEKMPSPH